MSQLKLIILSILISSIFSRNSNTCAWGSLGANQPSSATDCLSDQSDPNTNCCYMNVTFRDGSTKRSCYQIPNYEFSANTDLQIKTRVQLLAGNFLTVQDFACRNSSPVKADTRNIKTINTCAYDNLNIKAPTKKEDCTQDIDNSGYYKCCYVKSTWAKESTKACVNLLSYNVTDSDVKDTYKKMGGELESIECAGSALKMLWIFAVFGLLLL